MKVCTLCGVEKDLAEFYKRAESPDGLRHDCKECVKHRTTNYYVANAEIRKAHMRKAHAKKVADNPAYYAEQYAATREQALKASKAYYTKNTQKRIAAQKLWAAANPEKVRQYKNTWKEKNVGAVREHAVRRRLACAQQTPAWADAAKIRSYYDVCAFFNEVNGYTKYHVDHIIPLRGKRVSGLHVHNNLQVIPAIENERKNNSFEVA